MQTITSKIVADKLTAYLHGKLPLPDVVDWAENIMMESDFEKNTLKFYEKL